MWAIARPTELKNVAPLSRTSGRNPEAENLRRSARVDPLANAGRIEADSALPWNIGMAEYRTSVEENGTRAAARAARPWVMRTALGRPVEPDVKISR